MLLSQLSHESWSELSHLPFTPNHTKPHHTTAQHTIHIFQILDVVLFDALKKHATGLSTLDEEQSAVAFIIKVYHNFKQTMV
jgi:hypothetical protein